MTTEVALGALAAAGAAACYETSYALQALEARRVPVSEHVQVSLLARLVRRPLWLGAIAIAVAGWPLQLLALALAPLTLVQPIIALGVVLLLVLASRILHERIGPRELLGCAGIVARRLRHRVGGTEAQHVPRRAGRARRRPRPARVLRRGALRPAGRPAPTRGTAAAGRRCGRRRCVGRVRRQAVRGRALGGGLGGGARVRSGVGSRARCGPPQRDVGAAALPCRPGRPGRRCDAGRDPGRARAARRRRALGVARHSTAASSSSHSRS